MRASSSRTGRYDVLDGARRGLTLRVFPTGTKTFVFRYQRNGAVARITLGNYPTMPLRLAYEAHAELTKRLNRGEDPRATPRGAAAPSASSDSGDGSPPTGPTVGELAAEFLRRYVQRERKRPEEAEKTIERNI